MLARRLRKKIRMKIKMRKTDKNKTVEIVLERGIIGLQIVKLLFTKDNLFLVLAILFHM